MKRTIMVSMFLVLCLAVAGCYAQAGPGSAPEGGRLGRAAAGQDKNFGREKGGSGKGADEGRAQLRPCRESIGKLCKGSQGSRDSVLQCLKKHEAALPAACKKAMKSAGTAKKGQGAEEGKQDGAGGGRGQKSKKEMEDCKADIEEFCKDVELGGGRVLKCLKEREDELSAGCRKNMKNMKPPKGGQRGGGRGGEGAEGEGGGEEGPGGRGSRGEGPGGEGPGEEGPGGE